MLAVGNHADDGVPRLIVLRRAEANAFAKGTLARPILFGEGFADDNDAGRVEIVLGEISSLKQGNGECSEIPRSDHNVVDEGHILEVEGMSFDGKNASPTIVQRNTGTKRSGNDSRKRRDFFRQTAEHRAGGSAAGLAILGIVNGHRQSIFRAVTEIL